MSRIKTKETVKDIKVIDKAAVASQRMKTALIRAKDQTNNLIDDGHISPSEYAEDKIRYTAEDVTGQVQHKVAKDAKKAVKKQKEARSVRREEERIRSAEERVNRYRSEQGQSGSAETPQRTTRPRRGATHGTADRNTQTVFRGRGRRNTTIRTVERTERTIKQSARSAGTQTIKRGSKGTVKTSDRAIKTAEKTSKTAIKTAEKSAQAARKAAEKTARAAQKAAEVARRAAIAARRAAIATAKAVAKTIKAIIEALKELISAIIAGGWVSVVVIVIILIIGMIAGSVYGIFLSNEDTGTGMQMRDAIARINNEFQAEIQSIKAANPHDEVEMTGTRAIWKDVLAVYAVKLITDPDNPQEVASMDEDKFQILRSVFWDMNEISYRVESSGETATEEIPEEDDIPVMTESEPVTTTLYITIKHKTPEEMAEAYGFSEEQRRWLEELLSDENESLWGSAFYGVNADGSIVEVALSQVGNTGETYWTYMGFGGRVEWCACFVSWCANECGYIESGIIPRFSLCDNGVQWFKDRGQWLDGGETPVPGCIIFFDYNHNGETDHVGIVEKAEGGYVWTIEGNAGGDQVCHYSYSLTSSGIYGYGTPDY